MSRRIARPLLASIFVVGGIDALRNPAGKATKGEIVVGHLSESVDAIPADPVVAVQVNGAIQIGAGVLLAIGKFRRLAALALIVSIVPTTLAGHRFWEESDQVSRKQQKIHFLKNLGLLGGLILAALDTEGEPSLGWRAKRRIHAMETAIAVGGATTSSKARRTARKSRAAANNAGKTIGPSLRRNVDFDAHRIADAGTTVAELVPPAAREGLRNAGETAMQVLLNSGGSAAEAFEQASSAASNAARPLVPLAETVTKKGLDVVGPHLTVGVQRASDALSRFSDLAAP